MSDAVQRGRAAQTEIGLTDEAFAAIRQKMVDGLIGSALGQAEVRERLYMGINALDSVQKALKTIVLNGQHQQALDEMANDFGAEPG
jgi:hypothetical protein